MDLRCVSFRTSDATFNYIGLTGIILRAYSTAVVANALDVDRRWLDGLIASNRLDSLRPQRQGKSRAIPPRVVLTIAIAMELIEGVGASLPTALALAAELIGTGEHSPTEGLLLRVDVAAIERRIAQRLNDAVEAHPPARRGRPPRRARSRVHEPGNDR
jgi:hypothetical protein